MSPPARRLIPDEPLGGIVTWPPALQDLPPALRNQANVLLRLVQRPDVTTFRPQRDILD